MNTDDCEVGMPVLLTAKFKPSSEANPIVGSKFECQGTIESIDGLVIKVIWDNGHTNLYMASQLSVCNGNKSIGFCKDIWGDF